MKGTGFRYIWRMNLNHGILLKGEKLGHGRNNLTRVSSPFFNFYGVPQMSRPFERRENPSFQKSLVNLLVLWQNAASRHFVPATLKADVRRSEHSAASLPLLKRTTNVMLVNIFHFWERCFSIIT